MSILGFLNPPALDEGVERAKRTPGALLVDVRTREEYAAGHVPGSRNIPLDRIGSAELEQGRPLFLYCRSGSRSSQACAILRRRGYAATNLGGIMGYRGGLERGVSGE